MIPRILPVILLAAAAQAAINLPASRRLAGPTNDERASFGDALANWVFGSSEGVTNIHGWIAVDFDPPVGRVARFRVRWYTLGGIPTLPFNDGYFVRMTGEQTVNSSVQASQGDLNLDTGEISNLEVHALFQNVLIQKASKYNRLPLISTGDGFSALFVDFPPLDYPFELPIAARDRPAPSLSAKFILDGAQRITGLEIHGFTFVPIAVLPSIGLMPPFAFARQGITVVPGFECFPGTTPPELCRNEQRVPDGLATVPTTYLRPQLHLVTTELREVDPVQRIPSAYLERTTGAAAAALGGRLYVVGGGDGTRASTTAASFDPARNEWTGLPPMPRPLSGHCAAAANGRVWVAGGRQGAAQPPVAEVTSFDPGSRSWSPAPPLPTAVTDAACAAVDSRLFVFGGAAPGAAATDAAWELDAAAGRWSPLRMPTPLAGAAAAVSGREIWIVGGTPDGRAASDRVLVFNTATGAWREGPPSERPVHAPTAAWLEGRLYIAGGRQAPGGALDAGNVIYNSETIQMLSGNTWYPSLYQPVLASHAAGAVVGDTWYLVGGDAAPNTPAAPLGVVQAFQTARGWAVSDSYPVFTAQTVRNAAGLGVGPAELAPGSLASILGHNLAAGKAGAPSVRNEGRFLTTDLPDELAGVRVSIDGVRAGIASVSPGRIDFQVPFGLTPGRQVEVRVSRSGSEAPPVLARLAAAAPGLFTYTYGETRSIDYLNEAAAIVHNGDGKLNYPAQPARRGETVTIRATGLGEVEPRPGPLQRGPRTPSPVVTLPEVLIDGRLAAVRSAELAPGEAGIYNVRVVVPPDSRTGVRVLLRLRSGGILSNPAVFVIE